MWLVNSLLYVLNTTDIELLRRLYNLALLLLVSSSRVDLVVAGCELRRRHHHFALQLLKSVLIRLYSVLQLTQLVSWGRYLVRFFRFRWRLQFLSFNGWTGWRAVLSEAFLKELCEFWIRLFPLVNVVNLKSTEVFTGPLLDRHLNARRAREVAETALLKLKLEHYLLFDLFLVWKVEGGGACTLTERLI